MKNVKGFFVLLSCLLLWSCAGAQTFMQMLRTPANNAVKYFGGDVVVEVVNKDEKSELHVSSCCKGDIYSLSFSIPKEDKEADYSLAFQEEKWLPPKFNVLPIIEDRYDKAIITLPAPRCFDLTIKKGDVSETHNIHQGHQQG